MQIYFVLQLSNDTAGLMIIAWKLIFGTVSAVFRTSSQA
jgi:hypothetical protein